MVNLNKKGQEMSPLVFFGGIILCIIGVLLIMGFRIIEYNEYAYESEFGKLVNDLKSPGINWIGIGTVVRVNNQVRTYNIPVSAATKDMQEVNFDVNIKAKLKKDESFNYIKDYKDEQTFITYVNNKIQEKSKTIIFKYSATEMLSKRIEISEEILKSVSEMKELTYFDIDDISTANIKYSAQYDKILEEKAQLDVQRDILIKQKENMELQQKNLNELDIDRYFKYQLIEKWDGKSPMIVSDNIMVTAK